jgi:hypothetical protein
MRVLIIGPHHSGGSLPPYLDVLATGLRQHGVTVDRLGSAGTPYDQDKHTFWPIDGMLHEAHALLNEVNLQTYDLLSLHFGNLELEQFLPALWRDQPIQGSALRRLPSRCA